MWGKQGIVISISVFFGILCDGQETMKHYDDQISPGSSKLNVDIYLESLCGDSHSFIVRQLKPVWEDIADHVNIKFIPFGKSASENKTKFYCQHGSLECKGNRIMSCALSRITDQNLQVNFVTCFMDVWYKTARINENEVGKKCVEALGYDYNEIMENCYQTEEGTMRQLEAEIQTNKIGPQFIPTIVLNGEFNKEDQDRSLKNFRDVVCQLIKQKNPNACEFRTTVEI